MVLGVFSGGYAKPNDPAGDGTVLRSSALMDERVGGIWRPTLQSPIGWTDTLMLFTNHLGRTKDRISSDNVLYWLLEEPRNSWPALSLVGRCR